MARTDHRNPGRSGKGKFIRTPESAERDAEACRLRGLGHNYGEIAEQLGYEDASGAWRAVDRALKATVQEPAAHLRTIELARLDLLQRKAWDVLVAEHVVVNQGRVVVDLDTGVPLVDHGPVLAAIDRLLKISESRRKLLGLDAPARVEMITADDIDREVAKLAAELGMAAPPPLAQP